MAKGVWFQTEDVVSLRLTLTSAPEKLIQNLTDDLSITLLQPKPLSVCGQHQSSVPGSQEKGSHIRHYQLMANTNFSVPAQSHIVPKVQNKEGACSSQH